MYIKFLPWLFLLPCSPLNTKSSQNYLNLTNIGPITVGGMLIPLKRLLSILHNREHQVTTFPVKRNFKYRNPAINVPRRHEAVATDTVYSDTPAVDSGVKMAQLFVGKESLVSDIYPMSSGKQFVNTLEDNIHRRCAMDKLISDLANNEISHKVKDILRAYNINDWQSEPYHQNQNPAEWQYRTIKT